MSSTKDRFLQRYNAIRNRYDLMQEHGDSFDKFFRENYRECLTEAERMHKGPFEENVPHGFIIDSVQKVMDQPQQDRFLIEVEGFYKGLGITPIDLDDD